jgi:putative endonuclease
MPKKLYYVYIMTNPWHTLYIGMTNDLPRRVWEHKQRHGSKFTAKYHLDRPAYYESTDDVTSAIEREKELKGWVRRRKVALIESVNPNWDDLSSGWFEEGT